MNRARGLCFFAFLLIISVPATLLAQQSQPTQVRILQSASELDYPPFAVVKPDGSAGGFSVDLLNAAANAVGMKVRFTVGPWHEVKQLLIGRKIDVLPLVSYSKERDRVFDFTAPYLRMHGTIFVRKGEKSIKTKDDLKGKEVLVMKGDTAQEYAQKENLTDKLILTESFEQAMKMLSEGKHDAVVVQQLVGLQIIKKLGLSNLATVESVEETSLKPTDTPLAGFEQKFCIAVQEGDKKLQGLLNEGLAIVITNGTYNRLYAKWFSPILPSPPVPLGVLIRQVLYIIGPILVILLVIGLWYTRKQVSNKTAHLQMEIENRKQAEKRLIASEMKYRNVVEGATEGIFVVRNNRYLYVNRQGATIFGYAVDEILGSPTSRFIHPGDLEICSEQTELCLNNNNVDDSMQHRIIDGSGCVKWVEVRGITVDWDGEPASMCFVNEITERKRDEDSLQQTLARLHESEKELTALYEAGQAVMWSNDFTTIAREIFNHASELIGSTAGYVALLSDDGEENELLFLEAGNRPCTVAPNLPMPIRGLRAESYKSGQPVFDNDFHNSDWMRYMPAGHVRLDNVLFAPLNIENKTVGIMGLANKENGFTDRDAHIALQFAELAAIALNNRRLISQITAANTRLHALWKVASLSEVDTESISDHVLRSVIEMTESEFGFYGFMNEDESVMTIHSWSVKAMEECSMVDNPRHFLIDKAGVWAEAVRRREPLVINDYGQDYPGKKGLPEGHVTLSNLLVVPHLDEGKIVSVAAVANRDQPYDHDDISQVKSFLTSAQSIFNSRRAAEAVKQSEAALIRAQRVARIGSWWFDPVTRQPKWTEEMFRVFGLEPADQAPHYDEHKQFIHPDDWQLFDRSVARAVNQGIGYNLELRTNKPDGAIGYINAICEPEVDDSGKIVRLVGTAQDITLIKQGEAQRKELETQLRQAQKMEAVGTLAGGIAHDFNNILAAIIGFSELLLDDIPPQMPYYENAESILKSALRAKDLVQQILSFSRQAEHDKKSVRLRPIINETIKLLRATIPTTIEIVSDLEMDYSPILADPTQIHQVVMNLGTNAAHAMRNGGGTLTISLEKVQLDEALSSQFVKLKPGQYQKLTIRDTGEGMTRETLTKVFDPFFTTKEIGEGTGMGLSVVHGIMENHHGGINVESVPEQGTTFTIYFPVVAAHMESSSNRKSALPKGAESILFVDDEESLTDLNKKMLQRLGYNVTVENSSLKALEDVKSNPDRYDLVITDMTMPKMTGLDLSKEIISIKPGMPIILCTGFSNQVNEETAKEYGVRKFLYKPLSIKDAADAIRELLDA